MGGQNSIQTLGIPTKLFKLIFFFQEEKFKKHQSTRMEIKIDDNAADEEEQQQHGVDTSDTSCADSAPTSDTPASIEKELMSYTVFRKKHFHLKDVTLLTKYAEKYNISVVSL